MDSTTTAPVREWARKAVYIVDRLIFSEPDLDAVRRGWEVRRTSPFTRVYRDPRWSRRVSTAEAASSIGGSP